MLKGTATEHALDNEVKSVIHHVSHGELEACNLKQDLWSTSELATADLLVCHESFTLPTRQRS